ncbi:MAG TPA: AlkA N-terminal domain-containing protein [Streptosporangiaceae bacterium]
MTGDELLYRAVLSNDSRFDGRIYIGVTSTGIYCRPTCPARTPKRANMRFFRTAAAAQGAGFRACKRCRPDATPGSPEWNTRADVAGRAMRLIADGLVDREGVGGLAARLNYSERQLQRVLVTEVGAGPLALARAQRARTAQMLLETTDLSISDVAFAAGFASIRQFNETVRQVFALTPTELRARAAPRSDARPTQAGGVTLRLPVRLPFDLADLLTYLGGRAVAGVEEYADGVYRRALALPHGAAVVAFAAAGIECAHEGRGFLRCELYLEDLRDLTAAVQRCRRLLDLDADPRAVDELLGRDGILAPLVARSPGRRVPGCTDPHEVAIRGALGQHVTVAPRSTALITRLAAHYGKPLTTPIGGITHTFPTAEALADLDPAELPTGRRAAVRELAAALASGDLPLNVGAEREEAVRRLRSVTGLPPRVIAYIRMRALGDPDVLVPTTPILSDVAESWRPWRSYAFQYLRSAD